MRSGVNLTLGGAFFLHPGPLHWRFPFFVASVPVWDLLICAKYLIVAATFTTTGASWGMADHPHTIDRWDDGPART